MSTPITLSGFNNIDFASIVTALIARERLPEAALQQRQKTLSAQSSNLSDLATKLSALDTAVSALASPSSLSGRSVSNSDSAAVSFTAGANTPLGTYDIVVNELARAQVTATTPAVLDPDTTAVATGGTLTIGGVDVTLSGNTTLQGLADAINSTDDVGVTASVVKSSATEYSLVLTGTDTGSANSFAITNNLTGSTLTFAANAVEAGDASITVNHVTATSSTNTFTDAVTGATISVLKKDPLETVTITANQDAGAGKTLIANLVSAYNDLAAFVQNQQAAANGGDDGSLGHDSVLRSVVTALRQTLSGANTADSTFQDLASVGLGFTRTGQLTFSSTTFDAAASSGGLAHLQTLFSGDGSTDGVFQSLHSSITLYTGADGLVTSGKTTRTTQIADLDKQIADFEARLKVRQEALQRQFTAADQAISALNSQTNALGSLGSQFRLF